MCGITGAVWTDSKLAITSSVLEVMTQSLVHRGPDDKGSFVRDASGSPDDPGVAMGFRRLSIIDLGTGNQPVSNQSRSIQLVFNGEIYNYKELRRELEQAGYQFRSQGDAEVIAQLYDKWGEECFEKLNGMFAIAIWDEGQHKLILARDRLGQKPLFYSSSRDRLVFASELKSMLAVPGQSREIDARAIDLFLTYQYVPHPACVFSGCQKLPPGHRAVYQDGNLRVEPFWQLDMASQDDVSKDEAVTKLRELLQSSVELRMQSDVPLGAFLSGGVDSSLIVALMQEVADRPVKTFSIGFPVEEYDESHFARDVAKQLGTEHHEFQVEPDAVEVLPQLVYHYDEPFADSSAIPTWYVARQTRAEVTVALSGDGGDELFAGYPRYRAVSLASRLDLVPPLKWLISGPLAWLTPGSARYKSRLRRMKRFAQPLCKTAPLRYLDWIRIFDAAQRKTMYAPGFCRQLADHAPSQFLADAWAGCPRDAITRASLADLVTYLPCDLMTKVDLATMAHGLECRQPFLDHRLVEFAARLPIQLKYRSGKGKWILREAFEERLPETIWQRPKMGFGVPLDRWFRHELRDMLHDLLLAGSARCHQFVTREALCQMNQQHQAGQRDHSQRLWAVLMLELWLEKWAAG